MTSKKLIVQVSEGLGNQLFMYAHGYSLSKNLNYNMFIDNLSGYRKKKNLLRNHQHYLLNCFEIQTPLIEQDFLINNQYYNIFKKIFLFIDKFKNKKSFYTETKSRSNKKKIIRHLTSISKNHLSNKIYVLGNFENPEYFTAYKNDLIKRFQIKQKFLNLKNPFINQLQNNNSISIHLRRDKFSDQLDLSNNFLAKKSDNYTYQSIEYINRAIKYFNSNVDNPKFFIWTNNNVEIDRFINKLNLSDYTLIKNNDVLNDFYLFKFSKHFIVSPSTFHWWGAWLNQHESKVCVRPSDLNPSNNINFWPNEWIPI